MGVQSFAVRTNPMSLRPVDWRRATRRSVSIATVVLALLGVWLPLQPLAAQDLALLRGVVEVAAGSGHTCVLTDAGGVKCWGRNEAGQLGDIGPGELFYGDRLTAVDVAGLNAGVTAVTAGGGHACALTSGGGVKCWGANDAGQLGIGTTNFTRTSPSDVVGLTSGVIAISAGGRHTCAVMATRAVKCWGANADGQLGDGTTTNSSLPVDVSGLGGSVAKLSAGSNHTCVVTTGGAAQCWGRNDTAQLGDGTMVDKLLPTTVTGLGAGVGSITAGDDFSCAVTTAGAARCWGRNTFGQIGDGTNTLRTTATAVSGLGSGVSMLDAGVYHACAVSSDGAVRCWGWNASGQVGNGGASNFTLPTATPTLVSSVGGNVAAVAAGSEHSCARMSDSSVKCWGSSASGKLGDGTKGLQAVAADVHGLGSNVAAVAAGYEFGCAVTVAGRMVCWGNNGQGQLGNGTVVSSTVPGDVLSLSSGMIAVSAGMGTGGHACGLTSGRGLKCWGSGSAVGLAMARLSIDSRPSM
jgi:alpha-tubulin suppressor-like RCC1 family protein